MMKIRDTKSEFFIPVTGPAYHYTSLAVLEKLTRPNAKFRLSNVAYLNDPQEGKVLMSLAKKMFGDDFKGWSILKEVTGH